ncbi:ABC transporter ATP-binding protein [Phosphitispora sp. TUW77]|uniref:ABC transporter ATP-binding protein n=1 Tax=Phosphitispora sp. TUW77 TaxID=3152361 RepID=UPI003AB17AFB
MSTIIEVENLGKKYILRHQKQERYIALRDVMTEKAKRWAKRVLNPVAAADNKDFNREEFWALKDVSFKINQGDRVGIIGRNGAGKSTLLKILSRITEPTTGRVRLKGRVASLLEVGTGFHPELTGRENIYLNGAILGMSKGEIKRKFDEIVEFAEVEKFLDTPVKRYSSGMYVRLAFAVAAHLEPEILVVDEVLAVGDAQFQKKSLGKMEEVGKEGRTVLFVSHNMAAIKNLCTSSILLTQGQVEYVGKTQMVIDQYLKRLKLKPLIDSNLMQNDNLGVTLSKVDLLNDSDEIISSTQSGASVSIRMSFRTKKDYDNLLVSIGVNTQEDTRVCVFHTGLTESKLKLNSPYTDIICRIPKLPLIPGTYRLSIKVMSSEKLLFWLPLSFDIMVEEGDFYDTGRLPGNWGGICMIEHIWLDRYYSSQST